MFTSLKTISIALLGLGLGLPQVTAAPVESNKISQRQVTSFPPLSVERGLNGALPVPIDTAVSNPGPIVVQTFYRNTGTSNTHIGFGSSSYSDRMFNINFKTPSDPITINCVISNVWQSATAINTPFTLESAMAPMNWGQMEYQIRFMVEPIRLGGVLQSFKITFAVNNNWADNKSIIYTPPAGCKALSGAYIQSPTVSGSHFSSELHVSYGFSLN
ncbi:hypothetical protein TWF281_007773 [Arthrobotrys megalospora]